MYQFKDIGAGYGGGAVALGPGGAQFPASVGRSFGFKTAPSRLPSFDLVVDLGARLGSAEWYRGVATCVALCYAALSLAPGLDPLIGASPAPYTDAQMEQVRTLSFTPLAYGADTGKRMTHTGAVRPLTDAPERPSIDFTATLGSGSFAYVLARSGVGEAEAAALEQLIGTATALDDLKPGTLLNLTLGRRPAPSAARPVEHLAFRASFGLRVEVRRVDGRLTLTRIPIAVDDTPLRVQGRVGSGLYHAARASGAPAKAVETYIRAIATQIDIGSLDPDDRFDIILEQRRAETGEIESGKLMFAGLDRAAGKSLQLLQWNQGGSAQWFEASGVGKQTGMLQRPVPGSVSSSFGMRRHPILGYSRMHKGMDFRAGYGTPIVAATDGRIVGAGWAGGYGKQVRINHAGGLTTTYSHMSRIIAEPGEMVRQGQLIGYVGSTGLSTGPHLHYELYSNGVPINPVNVRFVTRSLLSGNDLAAFRAKLRTLLALPVGAAQLAGAPAAKPKA